jgi:hypothetical protein
MPELNAGTTLFFFKKPYSHYAQISTVRALENVLNNA